MNFSPADLDNFWSAAWSLPLRKACPWLVRAGKTNAPPVPSARIPRWLGPACIQRWAAQTVAARLAWLRAHPTLAARRFIDESAPCWEAGEWALADRRGLRQDDDERVVQGFLIEVERLLRIAREPPELFGEEVWASAALCACEHLARCYIELKRRQPASGGKSRAMRARAILREEMRRYVEWVNPVPERSADAWIRGERDGY